LVFYGIYCAISLFCEGGLQANPAQDPKRVVNEHAVDLTPLFHWWTNHSGARPLRSWAHLTGTVLATNSLGWQVEAKSDWSPPEDEHGADAQQKTPDSRIVLKNPPAAEKAQFEKLSAELAALNKKRSELAREQAKAKQEVEALAHSGGAPRARSFQVRQARAVENEAGRELKSIDAAIRGLKKKIAIYPNAEHFVLDCFALHTDQEFKGMRVYDHGAVFAK
jgi:hypothetical protein